jgi:hypothetical protein
VPALIFPAATKLSQYSWKVSKTLRDHSLSILISKQCKTVKKVASNGHPKTEMGSQ